MKPAEEIITLDRPTTDRCVEHGQQAVRDYADGRADRSLAFSSHGAERDAKLQAASKMAECILARRLGLPLDPLFNTPFFSYDVATLRQTLDVKQTGLHGRYLIWPVRKNDIFASKAFDHLALVKSEWNRGVPIGWIEKWEFHELKVVAGPGHRLTEGTWHVDESILHSFNELPGYGQAPPSRRQQIETIRFAAERLGKSVRMRPSERLELIRHLNATADYLEQVAQKPGPRRLGEIATGILNELSGKLKGGAQ
jgi:hypothetical protein